MKEVPSLFRKLQETVVVSPGWSAQVKSFGFQRIFWKDIRTCISLRVLFRRIQNLSGRAVG